MNTYRKNAISVGVLFIIATVLGVLGKTKFLGPILDAPDFLIKVSANQNQSDHRKPPGFSLGFCMCWYCNWAVSSLKKT